MDVGTCRLCGRVAPLQDSHFVPKFVFRWLKETSATGFLRFSPSPNLRAQDGPKSPLLCAGCEGDFNKWETEFANNIFYPLVEGRAARFVYSEWMAKFSVSLSWRTLVWYSNNDWGGPITSDFLQKIGEVESVWRHFLLGRRDDIDRAEQHFLALGMIDSAVYGDMPPNINRYLMRAVSLDLVDGGDSRFVYSKFGPFIILGFVEMPEDDQWVGTKIELDAGNISHRDYVLPAPFGKFLFEKAFRMSATNAAISPAQRKKIDVAMMSDLDRTANSDSFRAMMYDVRLFGRKAFKKE